MTGHSAESPPPILVVDDDAGVRSSRRSVFDVPASMFSVRARWQARTWPIILMTGSGDGYSLVTGLGAGADDFLAMPVRLDGVEFAQGFLFGRPEPIAT